MNGFFSSSEVLVEKPMGSIPKCGSCGLFKACNSPKMAVGGDGAKRVLVVGEAPSAAEDEEGKLFVGKSGRYLRDVLRGLGVRLERDAWLTNALICRTQSAAKGDLAKQIDYCRPNINRAIADNQPRVIVTLGRAALVSVIEPYWKKGAMRELESWVGWKIPLEQHWVVPTYHPAFLLRMKNSLMDRLFGEHLERAFSITKDPPKQPDWKAGIEVMFEDDEVCAALQEMDRESDWVAVDYETNCLKPEYPKAKIYSMAVSNGERTISYPWAGKAIEVTGEFLRSKRTRKIASNLKMEERWTRKTFGHGVRNWGWDTMVAAHCLDNRQGITSLKFQSLVKMGVPLFAYNREVSQFLESHDGPYNRINQIETKTLLLYGGMDGVLEHKLARKQRKEMGYAD